MLVDVELRGHGVQAGPRVVQHHATLALGHQHPAAGQRRQAHRLDREVVQRDLLEAALYGRPAVARDVARGPADPTEQELLERRLAVGLLGVAETRVERAAARVVLAPRDRVVGAHRAVLVARLVERRQHVDVAARVGAVVVPLVKAAPAVRQVLGGRMVLVGDLDRRLLLRRVLLEVRADEVAVERPVVLGVGRRVDPDVSATVGDVVLERVLLPLVEHVTGRAQEDHRVVVAQVRGLERGRVLGRVDGEVVRRAQLLDPSDSRLDRVVPEARGLGEHQDLELRCGRSNRREREYRAQRRDQASRDGCLSHREPPSR